MQCFLKGIQCWCPVHCHVRDWLARPGKTDHEIVQQLSTWLRLFEFLSVRLKFAVVFQNPPRRIWIAQNKMPGPWIQLLLEKIIIMLGVGEYSVGYKHVWLNKAPSTIEKAALLHVKFDILDDFVDPFMSSKTPLSTLEAILAMLLTIATSLLAQLASLR